MKKITQEEIEQLRATVGHAGLDDLSLTAKVVDEDVEDILVYLRRFASFPRDEEGKVDPRNPCLGCGEPMAGSLVDQLLTRGGFTWGLSHGHGHCRNCVRN